jgi:DNA-binding MarR family transcriptional regulator
MRPEVEFRECMSCSCFAVRRAARAITQHYDRHLRPSGLRTTQFTLLAVLTLGGRLPLGRAAEQLGADRTTLTRNLRPLVDRGFVKAEPGEDRRVQVLEVTPKGVSAARAALPLWREAQRAVTSRATTDALLALDQAAQAARAAVARSSSPPSHTKRRISTKRRKER